MRMNKNILHVYTSVFSVKNFKGNKLFLGFCFDYVCEHKTFYDNKQKIKLIKN